VTFHIHDGAQTTWCPCGVRSPGVKDCLARPGRQISWPGSFVRVHA